MITRNIDSKSSLSCLRRRTTRVLFRPYLDTDVSSMYAVQGCHLYRSILSMTLAMFQNLQSFPLHHFLSPKLKFLHAVESLSPCLIRSCQRYVLYICQFLWLLPFKHDSMTYQVQIKFTNFQRRYLVRIIQLLSFNVVVILFQPLRLLPFTFSFSLFLTHFNLSKVINIVLLHKLQRDNAVPRKFSYCPAFSWI